LSNLEFSSLCEIMGHLPWAPEVFKCQAPDVPNMILLQHLATPEQKRRWLRPMLEATAKSAFALTEPDRATQIFGAMGGSDQVPIHQAYAYARGLRIGDEPDEVHLRQIFRTEAGPAWSIADSPYVLPAA
jgi:alkylation response protein AidB-like acyl-CoA dehydrogenase